MEKNCWTCKFSSDNSGYPNCNSNPDSPTYDNIGSCTVNNFWQPIEENKMKCRNDNCSRQAFYDESGCDKLGLNNLYKCKIHARLLPLWEFQDKWEDRTKCEYEYEITEMLVDGCFGRVKINNSWRAVKWLENGDCTNLTDNCNLIPKSKQWYGLVDDKGDLHNLWQKSASTPSGFKVIKLKEDK